MQRKNQGILEELLMEHRVCGYGDTKIVQQPPEQSVDYHFFASP